MKIIFLDIDGVLNCHTSKSRCGAVLGIDNSRVKLLRHIVLSTDAKIVLCSSWKAGWHKEYEEQSDHAQYLTRKLRRQGLYILDRTREIYGSDYRGTGIKHWLTKCPNVESWVVLDDEIFTDYEYCGILPFLIKTEFYGDGLTEELAEQAITILNK